MPPLSKQGVDTKGDEWTYGAEHEFCNWDARVPLPNGFARSPDYTIVNNNPTNGFGIAAHPRVDIYPWGGEINTPPSNSIGGQLQELDRLMEMNPQPQINYRSNLHLHIRVPGLKNSLHWLKRLQEYIHVELPKVLDQVEPLHLPYQPGEEEGAKKRYKRMVVSHHKLLTSQRLKRQLEATTVQEFFEREVPATKTGKPMWHAQPRLAVGLRQLLQTDTIEFRHFPGTTSRAQLRVAFNWCSYFLHSAFKGVPLNYEVWRATQAVDLPKFDLYQHRLEVGYQATCHGTNKPAEILNNIALIEKGKFYGTEAHKAADARARGLSR